MTPAFFHSPPDDRPPSSAGRADDDALPDLTPPGLVPPGLVHDTAGSEDLGQHDPAPDDLPPAALEPSDAAASYWRLSSTPLTSLVFTLPLVLAYEGGVLLLGRGSPRNGADVWLRHLLDGLGFGQYFLLPLLTILGLLAWQFLAHERWQVSLAALPGMAAECVLWACVLIGVARMQQHLWPTLPGPLQWEALAAAPLGESPLARLIGYCGAGLYEEVLFRLLVLPVAVWCFERLGFTSFAAAAWAILLSSLLFSAAHYVGPLGDTFALYSFTFRTVAGLFFALLFLLRGFGIAAGSHFFYDVLVGLA